MIELIRKHSKLVIIIILASVVIAMPLSSTSLARVTTEQSPDSDILGLLMPAGSEDECDVVVNVDCYPGPWKNTGEEWCGFSLACIINLPPFEGHFVEQEQYTKCYYRCANGTTYIKINYRRRALRTGCCGGSLHSGDRNEPGKRHCY